MFHILNCDKPMMLLGQIQFFYGNSDNGNFTNKTIDVSIQEVD